MVREEGCGREDITFIPHRLLNCLIFFNYTSWSCIICEFYFFLIFKIFWLHRVACGILVPWPGIKPVSPALEAWSLNHWTAREVLICELKKKNLTANFIYLFLIYFWLHWVFIAGLGLSLVVVSGATLCCGAWASHCGGFCFCGAWALGTRAQ